MQIPYNTAGFFFTAFPKKWKNAKLHSKVRITIIVRLPRISLQDIRLP